MLVPEIVRQLHDARVQQIGIFQHMIVEVLFGRQAHRTRLDAHVDVFRDQHDGAPRILQFQRTHYTEDLVIGFAERQSFRQADVLQFGLEEQAAARILVAQFGQGYALVDCMIFDAADQSVQRTRYLAGIARDFRHAFLVVVQFLQGHHRQVDIVLLETEQRRRIMHQHIGVEYKQLGYAQFVGSPAGA